MAAHAIAKADGPFLTSGTFNDVVNSGDAGSTRGYQQASNDVIDVATGWPSTTSYVAKANSTFDGPLGVSTDGVMLFLKREAGATGTFSVKKYEIGGLDEGEITVDVADLPATAKWVFFKWAAPYVTRNAFYHNIAIKSSVNATVTVYGSATSNDYAFLTRKTSVARVPLSGETAYIVGELTGQGTGSDRYVTPGVEAGITVEVGQRGFHSAPPSPPTVSSVAASSGPAAGGTSVTLTGTNFTGATAVTFGGSAATGVSVVNSTTITCTTPAHAAGAVDVAVTNPDGTGTGTNAYTYVAAPTVSSVAASSGPAAGSTAVTITGTGFSGVTGVTFGGTAATGVSVVNSTTITCTTPAHAAGAVNVVVTNGDGQTGTGANAFTFVAAPTVSSVAASSGPAAGGTNVTITGTGFSGATGVSFGGTAATNVVTVNSTTITCTTPAHAAGAVSVVVTNGDTQTGTGSNAFTFVAAPTISAVSPSHGPIDGGTALTLTGTGFSGVTGVTVGGTAATAVSVVNSTTVTCTAPAHASGTVSVVLTNGDGQTATASSSYTYENPAAPPAVGGVVLGLGLGLAQ